MSRDVKDRLELFAERNVNVIRAALNMDQVKYYNPPENPAKMSDSRALSYVSDYGYSSWELDALEPSVLASIVRNQVENLMDINMRNLLIKKQEDERKDLIRLAKNYL